MNISKEEYYRIMHKEGLSDKEIESKIEFLEKRVTQSVIRH